MVASRALDATSDAEPAEKWLSRSGDTSAVAQFLTTAGARRLSVLSKTLEVVWSRATCSRVVEAVRPEAACRSYIFEL